MNFLIEHLILTLRLSSIYLFFLILEMELNDLKNEENNMSFNESSEDTIYNANPNFDKTDKLVKRNKTLKNTLKKKQRKKVNKLSNLFNKLSIETKVETLKSILKQPGQKSMPKNVKFNVPQSVKLYSTDKTSSMEGKIKKPKKVKFW